MKLWLWRWLAVIVVAVAVLRGVAERRDRAKLEERIAKVEGRLLDHLHDPHDEMARMPSVGFATEEPTARDPDLDNPHQWWCVLPSTNQDPSESRCYSRRKDCRSERATCVLADAPYCFDIYLHGEPTTAVCFFDYLTCASTRKHAADAETAPKDCYHATHGLALDQARQGL